MPPVDHPNAVTLPDVGRARIRRAVDLLMAGTVLRPHCHLNDVGAANGALSAIRLCRSASTTDG